MFSKLHVQTLSLVHTPDFDASVTRDKESAFTRRESRDRVIPSWALFLRIVTSCSGSNFSTFIMLRSDFARMNLDEPLKCACAYA